MAITQELFNKFGIMKYGHTPAININRNSRNANLSFNTKYNVGYLNKKIKYLEDSQNVIQQKLSKINGINIEKQKPEVKTEQPPQNKDNNNKIVVNNNENIAPVEQFRPKKQNIPPTQDITRQMRESTQAGVYSSGNVATNVNSVKSKSINF